MCEERHANPCSAGLIQLWCQLLCSCMVLPQPHVCTFPQCLGHFQHSVGTWIAGRSAQSAARTLDAASAQLADASAAKMASIGQELLKDMQQGLQTSITAPLKQLLRLDSQLEVHFC